jgi:hypothetical protein
VPRTLAGDGVGRLEVVADQGLDLGVDRVGVLRREVEGLLGSSTMAAITGWKPR